MSFKFCPGNAENLEKYEAGGFHPVQIGDTFDHGHYKIEHKLGYGGFSTVWLAKDTRLHRYVAIKFLTADSSKNLRENVVRDFLLSDSTRENDLAISKVLQHFQHEGPNGLHTCLVFDVYGPNLHILRDNLIKFRPDIVRKLNSEIATTLAVVHMKDIAFGDLSLHNILLGLQDISGWSVDKVYEKLGEPRAREVVPWEPYDSDEDEDNENDDNNENEDDDSDGNGSSQLEGGSQDQVEENNSDQLKEDLYIHAPRNYYLNVLWHKTDLNLMKPEVVLTDLNEATFVGSSMPLSMVEDEGCGFNQEYMSPELAFGVANKHTKASDIWALGVIFYEMRAARALFETSYSGIQHQMQDLLGEAPAEWRARIEADTPEADLIVPAESIDTDDRLQQKINRIGDWLPWITMTPIDRRQLFIAAFDEDNVDDEGHMIAKTINKPDPPPPARLSPEEAADFTDLLSKMLVWEPEDRITIEEVLQHPWLNKSYGPIDETEPWISHYHPGWELQPQDDVDMTGYRPLNYDSDVEEPIDRTENTDDIVSNDDDEADHKVDADDSAGSTDTVKEHFHDTVSCHKSETEGTEPAAEHKEAKKVTFALEEPEAQENQADAEVEQESTTTSMWAWLTELWRYV
ncbi:hypothetical protein LTR64_007914 [Lithohypha guttulata]|uniref:uncharacterized protein n=1 Tax=Lithohypha guttulata TaxID=1690604 RepID=UPI002DDDDE1A|nr:hypothetical protein LTR51_008218 [Lithohypha guttulata]